MIVLWEPMYPGDARGKIPTGFFAGDPRVTSYWDPTEISGNWLAAHPFAGLGGGGIVWDAYYAFPADARWPADTIPTHAVAAGGDIIGGTDALQRMFVPLLAKRSR
jgi:hypothetical protein